MAWALIRKFWRKMVYAMIKNVSWLVFIHLFVLFGLDIIDSVRIFNVQKVSCDLTGSLKICGDICDAHELHIFSRAKFLFINNSREFFLPIHTVDQKAYLLIVLRKFAFVLFRIQVIMVFIELLILWSTSFSSNKIFSFENSDENLSVVFWT